MEMALAWPRRRAAASKLASISESAVASSCCGKATVSKLHCDGPTQRASVIEKSMAQELLKLKPINQASSFWELLLQLLLEQTASLESLPLPK